MTFRQTLQAQHQRRVQSMREAAVPQTPPPDPKRLNHTPLKAERLEDETRFLVAREEVLDTLRHGTLLAMADGGTLKPEFVVWLLICEAVQTLSRIRNREMKQLLSGTSSVWPQMVMSRFDVFVLEVSRWNSGMSIYDENQVRLPEPNDIEVKRMLVTLEMLRFARSRDQTRLRKCLLALAAGAPSAKVGAMWRPGQKINRQAVHDLRVRACRQIVGLDDPSDTQIDNLMRRWGIRWNGKGFGVV